MTTNTTVDGQTPRCGECSKFARSQLWCPVRATPRRADDSACEWGRSSGAAFGLEEPPKQRKHKHKGRG